MVTGICVCPVGTAVAKKVVWPLKDSKPPTAEKTVEVTPEAQVKVDPEIPQLPLDDFKVKPEPDAVAV